MVAPLIESPATASALPSLALSTVAFYPNIVTADLPGTWEFYTTWLGFHTCAETGGSVVLEHPGGARLGLLAYEQDGPLAEWIPATDGRGWWLRVEVGDVEADCARLVEGGVPLALPLAARRWGERSFAVRDPNGVIVLVAQAAASDRLWAGHGGARPVEVRSLS